MPEWKPPKDMPDEELLDLLMERHTPTKIPPCKVCGGKLSAERSGGGKPTVWACSRYEDDPNDPDHLLVKPGREKVADEHYQQSQFRDHKITDPLVLELVKRYTSKRACIQKQEVWKRHLFDSVHYLMTQEHNRSIDEEDAYLNGRANGFAEVLDLIHTPNKGRDLNAGWRFVRVRFKNAKGEERVFSVVGPDVTPGVLTDYLQNVVSDASPEYPWTYVETVLDVPWFSGCVLWRDDKTVDDMYEEW